MYKWIELKVNCRKKNWASLPTVGWASPNFILQFTFSCNSLVHDPGLNGDINNTSRNKTFTISYGFQNKYFLNMLWNVMCVTHRFCEFIFCNLFLFCTNWWHFLTCKNTFIDWWIQFPWNHIKGLLPTYLAF